MYHGIQNLGQQLQGGGNVYGSQMCGKAPVDLVDKTDSLIAYTTKKMRMIRISRNARTRDFSSRYFPKL